LNIIKNIASTVYEINNETRLIELINHVVLLSIENEMLEFFYNKILINDFQLKS